MTTMTSLPGSEVLHLGREFSTKYSVCTALDGGQVFEEEPLDIATGIKTKFFFTVRITKWHLVVISFF